MFLFMIFFRCYRDVSLRGYKIPQGTQIVPLLHAVHMDPTLWDEPEAFKPERFLSAEGKIERPEFFIPFGVGKREIILNKYLILY